MSQHDGTEPRETGHYTEDPSWALRKAGFVLCIYCKDWFSASAKGKVACPTCETTIPCMICRRIHPKPGLSCFQVRLEEKAGGDERNGVA